MGASNDARGNPSRMHRPPRTFNLRQRVIRDEATRKGHAKCGFRSIPRLIRWDRRVKEVQDPAVAQHEVEYAPRPLIAIFSELRV